MCDGVTSRTDKVKQFRIIINRKIGEKRQECGMDEILRKVKKNL